MMSLCRDCSSVQSGQVAKCPVCQGERMISHDQLGELTVAHIDCDAFYAAIEKRDNPELRNKPVIVGGGQRGVVATCCYIARLDGVRSAMPMFKALKACPNAIVIRPDFRKYTAVSRDIRARLEALSPMVQMVSIDEGYIDLSGTQRLHAHLPAALLATLAREIERDLGIVFDEWDVPKVDKATFESTRQGVYFGGDSAFGPENIIWAVEHGHQAAISIHKHCSGDPVAKRLSHGMNLLSTKMSLHEWSFSNDYDPSNRRRMRHVELKQRFDELNIEVELGFSAEQFVTEVERCLNCDIQTEFAAKLCIECDACVDICPVRCLTITENGDRTDLVQRLSAPVTNPDAPFYVSDSLPQTSRVMVKDENLCVHCALCAERCPTGAWDMRKSELLIPYAIDEEVAACNQKTG